MERGGGGANTRAAKRKAVEKGKVIGEAIKKAKVVIVSGGEEEELKLPFLETQVTMGQEHMDIIREMGRVMTESMNRNFEIMREQSNLEGERYRTMMENQGERYRTMMENQDRNSREGANNLVEQFERMRIAQEVARTQTAQKLPNYDGVNIEFDEWQDKVYACMTCNSWDIDRLLTALPTSLSGQAKRSFDTLSADDKLSRDVLFQALRKKLDPQAEKKNKELFMLAKKGPSESIMTFIDRCRMYIRRSGGDPKEPFAVEMMKFKVLDSLPNTDRKILNATVEHDEDLDRLIVKADAMLESQARLIGGVMDDQQAQNGRVVAANQGRNNIEQNIGRRNVGNMNGNANAQSRRPFQGNCWFCDRPGHMRRDCRQWMGQGYQQPDVRPMGYQGQGQMRQGPNDNGFRQAPQNVTQAYSTQTVNFHQNQARNNQRPPPPNPQQQPPQIPMRNPPPVGNNGPERRVEPTQSQTPLN